MKRLDAKIVWNADASLVMVVERVLFIYFRPGATTSLQVTAWRRSVAQLLKEHPKVIFWGVIHEKNEPPSEDTKKSFSRFFEDYREQIAVMLLTHSGNGLRGVAIRTVALGVLTMLSRARISFPYYVDASLSDSARRACEHMPGVTPFELLDAIRRVEKTL